MKTEYLHLRSGSALPACPLDRPYAAVVVLDEGVTEAWRAEVSTWLVDSGCVFMMAWGQDCSAWDDSVDTANIEAAGTGDIPEEQQVLTTWHSGEPLAQVFWFAQHAASHPSHEIERVLIIDVTKAARGPEVLRWFRKAVTFNQNDED